MKAVKGYTKNDYIAICKEEEGGELSMMTDTITIKNVATNRYYRARGLHMVEIGDEIEGCATETHGVLITKD